MSPAGLFSGAAVPEAALAVDPPELVLVTLAPHPASTPAVAAAATTTNIEFLALFTSSSPTA
jgi:hypothetical protein